MSEAAAAVRQAWIAAVAGAGGDPDVAAETADDLLAAYGSAARHYHGPAHVRDVLVAINAVTEHAQLSDEDRAATVLAGCAHDVVYDGRPGEDERASAMWAGEALLRAASPATLVARVQQLVLVTADHVPPPGDDAAAVLTDADLAILGSAPEDYDAYAAGVRAEYAHLPDDDWRRGRAEVLRGLLTRDPLYATAAGRQRWEAAARANLDRELDALT